MTRLLLIRHAQSAWNELGRWQGHADPPLSDLGRRQAAMAAARVGAVDAIVASPLERARATAAILAAAVGIEPVVIDDDLIERDVGEWSGLTRAEIERDWPGYLDEDRRPPGFEPDEALVVRGLAALDRIAGAFSGGEVLVVTHGGLIGAIERHHGDWGGRIPNLSGVRITADGAGWSLEGRTTLLDDDELTLPAPR